jgi:hypothetical protein
MAQTTSCARLEAGPAAATHNMSFLGWRRLLKLTGTGFAQPNMKGESASVTIGSTIVPTRSMCFTGFSVTRPCR